MAMYYENVEEYLAEYGTLTKTIIFSLEGEKLFCVPDDVEFSRTHFRAVLSCMADALHPLAGIIIGDVVYKCLRVHDGLLVGRSDTEEFVAYKADEILIVGFTDREKSGDCCLTDVKNVERELYRQPDLPEHDMMPEEDLVQPQETILQATIATAKMAKPRVMFQDGVSFGESDSPRLKVSKPHLPEEEGNDFEMVNAAFEGHMDDEEESFEKINSTEVDLEVPQVKPEEVELKEMADV